MTKDHISVNSESISEFEEEYEIDHELAPEGVSPQPASGEIMMSENGEMEWSSCLKNEPWCMAASVMLMSSFELFIQDDIQKIILDCSYLEGSCGREVEGN